MLWHSGRLHMPPKAFSHKETIAKPSPTHIIDGPHTSSPLIGLSDASGTVVIGQTHRWLVGDYNHPTGRGPAALTSDWVRGEAPRWRLR